MPDPRGRPPLTRTPARRHARRRRGRIAQLGAAAGSCGDRPRDRSHPGLLRVVAHAGTVRALRRRGRAPAQPLFRETTAANLCLLAAAVLSSWCSPSRPSRPTIGENLDSRLLLASGSTRAPARRLGGALRLSGARGQPAAPLARHARPAPRSRASTLSRPGIARQPPVRSPRPLACAVLPPSLPRAARWLVARASVHRRLVRRRPTAGAGRDGADLPRRQRRPIAAFEDRT